MDSDTENIETQSYFFNNVVGNLDYLYYLSITAPQSGIIYALLCQYTCNNCIFIENNAYAGILVSISSIVNFKNCSFDNNTYPTNLQGIIGYIITATTSSLINLIECSISNNGGIGGVSNTAESMMPLFGIYQSNIIITNSIIQNHTFGDWQGLLLCYTGSIEINNSQFSNNMLASLTTSPITMFKLTTGNMGIISSSFVLNTNILLAIDSEVMIEESEFVNNIYGYADPYAGCRALIYVNYCILYIKNSLFDDFNHDFQIKSTTLVNLFQTDLYMYNVTMKNVIGNEGGAILGIQSHMEIDNVTAENITFRDSGSVIYIIEGAIILKLTNSFFSGSSTPASYILIESAMNMDIEIQNCSFASIGVYPLIILSQGRNITFINNTLYNSSSMMSTTTSLQTGNVEILSSLMDFGIKIEQFQFLLFENCLITDLITTNGALLLIADINAISAIINCSIFKNNYAITGAALNLQYSGISANITLMNCIFRQNSVYNISKASLKSSEGKGAAIYYSCLNPISCKFYLNNCTFVGNTASVSGGAIFWDYYPPINLTELEFEDNNALCGRDFGSYPLYARYIEPQKSNDTPFATFYPISYDIQQALTSSLSNDVKLSFTAVSGMTIDANGYFALFDVYNQMINYDSESILSLNSETMLKDSSDKYYLFLNPSYIVAEHGIYELSSIRASYYPIQNISIAINFLGIKALPFEFLNTLVLDASLLTNSYNRQVINATLLFVDCPMGYFFSPTDIEGVSYGTCTPCVNETYLLDLHPFPNNRGPCIPCDHNINGGCIQAYLDLKLGIWRMNATSDILLMCNYPDACPGGMNTTNFTNYTCSLNYSGNLCNDCPLGQGKFGSEGECYDCQKDAFYYLKFIGVLFGQAFLIIYSVKCTMGQNEGYDLDNGETDLELVKSNLLKILGNYLQLLSLIGNIQAGWPVTFKPLLSASSLLSIFDEVYLSVDCFIRLTLNNSPIQNTYIRLLVVFASPYIISCLVWIFWVIYYQFKKEGKQNLRNKIITTLVIIIYTLQPTIIKFAFQLFQCVNLYRTDNPLYYLNSDYDIICWDATHSKWALGLGLTNFLIWGLIIPGFIFIRLLIHKHELNDRNIKLKYAFIYQGYKANKFYWEFFINIRKLSIVLVLVFIGQISQSVQILFAFFIIIVSLVITIRNNPYIYKVLNQTEEKSLISAGLVSFCALYFQQETKNITIDYIMLIIAIFGYCYLMINFCIEFGRAIKNDLKYVKEKLILLYNYFIKISKISKKHYKSRDFASNSSASVTSVALASGSSKIKMNEIKDIISTKEEHDKFNDVTFSDNESTELNNSHIKRFKYTLQKSQELRNGDSHFDQKLSRFALGKEKHEEDMINEEIYGDEEEKYDKDLEEFNDLDSIIIEKASNHSQISNILPHTECFVKESNHEIDVYSEGGRDFFRSKK